MGNLFPEDQFPEFPDHVPVPDSFPHVSVSLPDAVVVAPLCLAAGIYPLCPLYHRHQDEVPHHETVEVSYPVQTPAGAFGSPSARPFFGNTMYTETQVNRQAYNTSWVQSTPRVLLASV